MPPDQCRRARGGHGQLKVIVNAWLADRYLDGVGRAEVKRIACANHIDPGRQAGSGPIVVVNGDHNIVASCDESGYRDCDDIDGSKLPPTRQPEAMNPTIDATRRSATMAGATNRATIGTKAPLENAKARRPSRTR